MGIPMGRRVHVSMGHSGDPGHLADVESETVGDCSRVASSSATHLGGKGSIFEMIKRFLMYPANDSIVVAGNAKI